MLRASSRRMMGVLVSFLLLIGAIVVYSSFLKKEYAAINDERGQLASKKDLYENQKKIIDGVQRVLRQYNSTSDTVQTALASALPNEEQFPSLVNQTFLIANSSGMSLKSLNLSIQAIKSSGTRTGATAGAAPQGQKISVVKIGTIQLSLQLLGTYQALQNFLHTLEANIRITDIQTITFATAESGIYNYSIVANTYYQTK